MITQIKDAEVLVETSALRHKELVNSCRIKMDDSVKAEEEELTFLSNVENAETYKEEDHYKVEDLDFYNGYGGFDPSG